MERKNFLKTLSLAGISGAAFLTACNTTSTGSSGGNPALEGDAGLIQQAAEREAVAIQTYTGAIDSGLLSQGVEEVANLYRSHHEAHLVEFNDALISLEGDPILLNNFSADQRISNVTNELEAVELAMTLEREAAQAYVTSLVNDLRNPDPRRIFGDIFPIEVSHFVTLKAALDRSPAINSGFFSELTAE